MMVTLIRCPMIRIIKYYYRYLNKSEIGANEDDIHFVMEIVIIKISAGTIGCAEVAKRYARGTLLAGFENASESASICARARKPCPEGKSCVQTAGRALQWPPRESLSPKARAMWSSDHSRLCRLCSSRGRLSSPKPINQGSSELGSFSRVCVVLGLSGVDAQLTFRYLIKDDGALL